MWSKYVENVDLQTEPAFTLSISEKAAYDAGRWNGQLPLNAGQKMIKLNVTHRVFLAILAANAIIVLCMFMIMQWSMDRGFLKYANQLEQNRMERLAHVSTPAISFLISQIEKVVSRVKEADKVEALINCPPDEFTKKDGYGCG
jgi:hypothetical protein